MPDETAKFVEFVKRYPCLYNCTLPEYSQKDVTDRAWSEIAHQMKWLASDCKEKWRNIRNAYLRSYKSAPSGSCTKGKKRPYYLCDMIEFAVPYLKPVINTENTGNIIIQDYGVQHCQKVELTENVNDNIGVVVFQRAQDPPTSIEEKRMTNEMDQTVLQNIQEKKEVKTQNDPSKMFLLSLVPDVRGLSDKRLREFKILTMLLLEELITEQEQEEEHEDSDDTFRRPLPPHSSRLQARMSASSTSTDYNRTQ